MVSQLEFVPSGFLDPTSCRYRRWIRDKTAITMGSRKCRA